MVAQAAIGVALSTVASQIMKPSGGGAAPSGGGQEAANAAQAAQTERLEKSEAAELKKNKANRAVIGARSGRGQGTTLNPNTGESGVVTQDTLG